jgi:hypothetical protein
MATPRKDPKDHGQRGRPSKFDIAMCETVVTCMSKGYIVEEVCSELGIHRDTFFEWVKTYPDFSDCYKKGKAAFIAFWARAYKKVMMGIPLNPPKKQTPKPKPGQKKPASQKDKEKEDDAVELGKANPAMMIFYMKAHCGWRETVNNNNKVKISTIKPETMAELESMFGRTKPSGRKSSQN